MSVAIGSAVLTSEDASPSREITDRERNEERSLVSDLFHALNQPLAALHCSLELASTKFGSNHECVELFKPALELVERAAALADSLRTFWEAGEPPAGNGSAGGDSDLCAGLAEIVEELRPVAEELGVTLEFLPAKPCSVNLDPDLVREILFRLVDTTILCLYEAGMRKEPIVRFDVSAGKFKARLIVVSKSRQEACSSGENGDVDCSQHQLSLKVRTNFAIVRRILEARGGCLNRNLDRGQELLRVECAFPSAEA